MEWINNVMWFLLLASLGAGIYNLFGKKEKMSFSHAPDQLFDHPWANRLQQWSYEKPFVWFIDETEERKESRVAKELIAKSNTGHFFTYRSYMTLRVAVIGIMAIVLFIGLTILKSPTFLLETLMGLSYNADETIVVDKKIVLSFIIFCFLLALSPSFYLKNRAKKYQYYYVQDIPVIQLFIVLMLRSNKSVKDVLATLAKMETRYQEVFTIGYRMYLRDESAGLLYISEALGTSLFKETIEVLLHYSEYHPSDSIKILENNMIQIREQNSTNQQRADLVSRLMSQATLVLPMTAVLLLGLVPFAVYGLDSFNTALSNSGGGF